MLGEVDCPVERICVLQFELDPGPVALHLLDLQQTFLELACSVWHLVSRVPKVHDKEIIVVLCKFPYQTLFSEAFE